MTLDAGVSDALLGEHHPHVAEAVARALRTPDPGLRERYVVRLLERFPAPLSVCYLTHSVSEGTELALRLAREHRPGKDVIVHGDTEYGITTSLMSMSPARRKFWVHAASRTDARDVAEQAARIQNGGRGLCGFFAGGVFSGDYLREAYAAVRAAGGLNIALEGQTGMGRVGNAFWEFARQDATPDIVVVGPSMGNGFPMAAVVTSPALAARFDTGTGGGAAACAAGMAVLDVLVPPTWSPDFSALSARGAGLCWEIDVLDGPATVAALEPQGIRIAVRGNTLLFRPPLTFTSADADRFLGALRDLHHLQIPHQPVDHHPRD